MDMFLKQIAIISADPLNFIKTLISVETKLLIELM